MESLIMKYIVYSFKNAGIFNHKNRSLDVTEYGNIDVPNGTLYVNHVYNMLAVMFGERPIKSFKKPSNNGINLKYTPQRMWNPLTRRHLTRATLVRDVA